MTLAARKAISAPATTVGLIAGVTILLHLLGLAAVLRQLFGEQSSSLPVLGLGLAVFSSGALAMAMALRGAIEMAHLRNERGARAAALLVCVPFWSPLAPLGIIAAIWCFRVMATEEVKVGFGRRSSVAREEATAEEKDGEEEKD